MGVLSFCFSDERDLKIAVAGWPLRLVPYPKTTFALDWAMANGLDGVEITDNFFDFITATKSDLLRLKHEYDTHELEISALEPLWIGLFRDQKLIRKSIAKIERSIEVATLLGVELVILSPWQRVENPDRFVPLDRDFEEAANIIKPLVRKAVDNGVKLLIEGPHGQMLRTSEDILKLLDLVDDPDFGINIDFSNALPFLPPDESMEEFVTKLRRHVAYCHIKSQQRIGARGENGSLLWLGVPAGEGDINYRKILPLLTEVGYNSYLAIEKMGDEGDPFPQMKQSKDYIVSLFEDLSIPRG